MRGHGQNRLLNTGSEDTFSLTLVVDLVYVLIMSDDFEETNAEKKYKNIY